MPVLNPSRGLFFVSLEQSFSLQDSLANFLKQPGIVIFHKDPVSGSIKSYQFGRPLNSLSEITQFKGYQVDNKGIVFVNFPNKFVGFGVMPDMSLIGGNSPSPTPTSSLFPVLYSGL